MGAASTLATLLIRLGFDTTRLGPDAAQARSQIASVGSGAQGSANQFNNAIGSMENKMRSAAATASYLKSTLSLAIGFAGAGLLTKAVGAAEDAMIGFNARLEQARIGFATMLGSEGAADSFIAQMQAFANVTPFEFSGLQDAVTRMLAMGFATKDVLPTLTAVGDAVAGLGGNTEVLNRVTYALGQMKTAGRLNAQDMMQLTSTGIPAWQMLADAIGKTVAETRALSEKGLIPAQTAIDAIVAGMETKFGGLMAKQARTFQGSMSTIHDVLQQGVASAMEPVFNMITALTIAFGDFLQSGGARFIAPILMAIGVVLLTLVVPGLISTVGALLATKLALIGVSAPLIPLIAAVTLLGLAFQENFLGIRDLITNNLVPLGVVIGSIVAIITGKWVIGLAMSAASMAANAVSAIALSGSLVTLTEAESAATVSTGAFGGSMLAAYAPLLPIIAALALLGAAYVTLKGQVDQALKGIDDKTVAFAAKASIDELKAERERLEAELQKIHDVSAAQAAAGAGARPQQYKTAVQIALESPAPILNQLDIINQAIKDKTAEMEKTVKTASGKTVDATGDLIAQLGTSLAGVIDAASVAGGDAMAEMAKGISDAQNKPLDALLDLHDALKTAMTAQSEITRLMGALQTEELAAGMKSSDPAVRAQAEATTKIITERLDAVTDGAYSAGQNVGMNFGGGLVSPEAILAVSEAMRKLMGPAMAILDKTFGTDKFSKSFNVSITGLEESAKKQQHLANVWKTEFAPAANDVSKATAELDKHFKDLDKDAAGAGRSMSTMAADAKAALSGAFDAIREAAHRMFDDLHDKNLKAMDDAHRLADDVLSSQQKAIQGTVDAYTHQIEAERNLRKETELRAALTKATNPADQMAAQQALTDFLADQQAQVMQEAATTDIAKIQLQRDTADKLAAEQKAAEDQRYQDQVAHFDKSLTQLRDALERHPEQWRKIQGQILTLLGKYGVDYEGAGATLGKKFALGLEKQIDIVEAAARRLAVAGAVPPASDTGKEGPPIATVTGGARRPTGTGPLMYATGAWNLMTDQMAYLHAGEMVVPAKIADSLRAALAVQDRSDLGSLEGLFAGQQEGWKTLGGGGATPSAGPIMTTNLGAKAEKTGGGTVILMVGDRELGRISDERIAVEESLVAVLRPGER